jgi:O-antigen/teichoic acid export membrane protein
VTVLPGSTRTSAVDSPSLAFSGAHTVATNVLQVLGSFALAALIARSLGPEQKGAYDLYTTTATLLTTFLGMSVMSGIVYVTASATINTRRLASSVVLFAVLLGSVAWVFTTGAMRMRVAHTFIPAALGDWAPAAIGLGVTTLALSSMLRAILSGQRRFVAANRRDLAKQGIGLLLAALALVGASRLGASRLIALIAANIVCVAITAALFFAAVRDRKSIETRESGFRAAFAYSIPAHVGTVIQFLNYRLDVYFVNALAGVSAVGLYQTAVLLAQSLTLMPSAAQAMIFPTIAAAPRDRPSDIARVAQASRIVTVLSLSCAAGLAVATPWVIPTIFGRRFQGSVAPLLYLLPGSAIFATNTVLAGYFAGVGKPQTNALVSLIGLLLTIPLDIILIPRWGISGAAVASSLSYATTAGAAMLLFRRATGFPLSRLLILEAHDVAIIRQEIARVAAQVRTGSNK